MPMENAMVQLFRWVELVSFKDPNWDAYMNALRVKHLYGVDALTAEDVKILAVRRQQHGEEVHWILDKNMRSTVQLWRRVERFQKFVDEVGGKDCRVFFTPNDVGMILKYYHRKFIPCRDKPTFLKGWVGETVAGNPIGCSSLVKEGLFIVAPLDYIDEQLGDLEAKVLPSSI